MQLQFLEKELKSRPSTEHSHAKSPQPVFQYEVNEKVLDKLDVAASTSDEKALIDALEEGRKILKINVTLAEQYSWETVDCYVQEPLQCDSDDEKRIRRAVKESKKPLKPRAQLIGHSQQLFTSSQNSSSTRHKLDLSQHKGCFGC